MTICWLGIYKVISSMLPPPPSTQPPQSMQSGYSVSAPAVIVPLAIKRPLGFALWEITVENYRQLNRSLYSVKIKSIIPLHLHVQKPKGYHTIKIIFYSLHVNFFL